MKTLSSTLLFLVASNCWATNYICEADCFRVDPNGTTIYYSHPVVSGIFASNGTDYSPGFNAMKNQCKTGIALKRNVNSVNAVSLPPEYVQETNDTWITNQGYRYSVTTHNNTVRRYTIVRTELQANFNMVEATSYNACRPAVSSDYPWHSYDVYGNEIVY